MALFFTFAIECYREPDAARIGEMLRAFEAVVADCRVPMAHVEVFSHGEYWYVFANPKGPGYSQYGSDEDLNRPKAIAEIIERLYDAAALEPGIRRAICGYEAQDVFDLFGTPELLRFDTPDLIYDRNAASRASGAVDFGAGYYRNQHAE